MNSTQAGTSRIAFGAVILLAAVLLFAWLFFLRPRIGPDAASRAIDTRTALALTSAALLDPFPTGTKPPLTPTDSPTVTSTMPTPTPSSTRTPSITPSRVVTAIPRTREPLLTGSQTPVPPTPSGSAPTRPAPTSTPVPPTQVVPTLEIPTVLPGRAPS